ncbi:hypothetical protein [Streptomyces atroolivaceus]|uniref:hypothetical protein n=1 Tax=Streptomyces atroolivaceus TaxID=66869 RepID=UPI00378CC2EB
MEPSVHESVGFSAGCPDCGAELEGWGTHALVGGSLRWDTGINCPACGCEVLSCGDDEVPAGLRARLLADHGPARLQVDPSAGDTAIMRVLRVELGVDLANVRSVLHTVLTGDHSGTLPEMEFLARKLRAAGVDAVAARP